MGAAAGVAMLPVDDFAIMLARIVRTSTRRLASRASSPIDVAAHVIASVLGDFAGTIAHLARVHVPVLCGVRCILITVAFPTSCRHFSSSVISHLSEQTIAGRM